MRLYVANCTKQAQQVYFRLDFDKSGNFDEGDRRRAPKFIEIPSGRQVPIGGDLHQNQAVSIIDQLKKVGMIKFDEISRLQHIVPYIYREDAPVPARNIEQVHRHNQGIQITRGKERRARAAVAVNEVVNNIVSAGSKKSITEFEQVEQSELGEKRIEEGYTVPAVQVDDGAPKSRRIKKASGVS